MGKDTKRLSYRCSYQNFLLRHICFFILYVAGIGEYCFIVIFPSVHVILRSLSVRPQMMFAFVIPLVFILLPESWMFARYISFTQSTLLRRTKHIWAIRKRVQTKAVKGWHFVRKCHPSAFTAAGYGR